MGTWLSFRIASHTEKTVHFWKHQIQQDEVGMILMEFLHPLYSVAGQHYVISFILQKCFHYALNASSSSIIKIVFDIVCTSR